MSGSVSAEGRHDDSDAGIRDRQAQHPPEQAAKEFPEKADSLWVLTVAPLVWAVHFLACYVATAIVCAKAADDADMIETLRLGIAAATAVAILLIVLTGWRAWKQWDYLDDRDYAHDGHQQEDRHEFLGHAAFLLAVISLIGVVYDSLPALFMASCA